MADGALAPEAQMEILSTEWPIRAGGGRKMTSARLDLTAIRASHQARVDPRTGVRFCDGCKRGWPCLIILLLDALAEAEGRVSAGSVGDGDQSQGTWRAEDAAREDHRAGAVAADESQVPQAIQASAAAAWLALESIASTPCLTDLLGESKAVNGGCGCPACVAQATMATSADTTVARIARLEAVAEAARELLQRPARGGTRPVRLRDALAALDAPHPTTSAM
jgi:hypothetical protein